MHNFPLCLISWEADRNSKKVNLIRYIFTVIDRFIDILLHLRIAVMTCMIEFRRNLSEIGVHKKMILVELDDEVRSTPARLENLDYNDLSNSCTLDDQLCALGKALCQQF